MPATTQQVQRNNLTMTQQPTREDSGLIRHESFDGQPHIVMPAILVRSQVLGQEEFLPFEEIEDSVEDWRGVPVVVYHPEENGEFVSARKIDIREQTQVGFVANPKAVPDQGGGKLAAELWLDEMKVRQDAELSAKLEEIQNRSGAKIEVSTGYRCKIENGMGMDGSTKFYKTQRDIRPDHLALLPNGVGKCSVADGAGAPRLNQREVPREPEYDGTETVDEQSWGEISKDLGNYIDGYFSNTDAERPEEDWNNVDDLTQAARQWIASKTLLGVSNADTTDELIFFPVVNPNNDYLSEGALLAVIGGRGEQADIETDTLTKTQALARGLLEEEFDMAEEENKENAWEQVKNGLQKLIGHSVEVPEEEKIEEVDEEEKDESQKTGGEENVSNESEQDQRLAVLEEAGIEDAEGLAEIINAGVNHVNNEKEKKESLIEELSGNEAVEVDSKELEALSVNSLESLKIAITKEEKTNYEGQGAPRNNGGRVNDSEEGPTLKRPDVYADEN